MPAAAPAAADLGFSERMHLSGFSSQGYRFLAVSCRVRCVRCVLTANPFFVSVACSVDRGNLGPSYIVGLGNYKQGALWVQTLGAVDVKHRWTLFNGNVPHCTLPYTGTRYTLIYFVNQYCGRLGNLRPRYDGARQTDQPTRLSI
eukprot:COSAG06_NODE_37_length_30537_cov_73.315658_23_plen_145_part_00